MKAGIPTSISLANINGICEEGTAGVGFNEIILTTWANFPSAILNVIF